MKKYVPRSIQNIFDRIEAYNESITEKLFSETLPTTFEVIVYDSKDPEVRTSTTPRSTDDSSRLSNYLFYKARSLSGHHDHLTRPESATTVDQYERFRNAHFQAIVKPTTVDKTPKTGDVWLATMTGANLVTLVSKERELNIRIDLKKDAGPARLAHSSGEEPAGTNADHASTKTTVRRSEPPKKAKLEGIQQDSFPFFNVDPAANRELLNFIAKGEAPASSYSSTNRLWYPRGQGKGFEIKGWPKPDGTGDLLHDGLKLVTLTIEKVISLQSSYTKIRFPKTEPKDSIFAAGRYQVIPKTMLDHLAETGLTKSDIYNENNQDLFGLTLIYGTKRPDLRDYLMGADNITLDQAQISFSQEWSSVPKPNGKSYYGETAHHTSSATRALLEKVRKANLHQIMESAV